ncbi:MAG TPA: Tad domain-containing protein [Gammaproteobacteria bacterium]|nr:Tad domain-containing protein [Gammaproteobacteria bacterium]
MHRRERGAILLMTVFLVILLLGFGAFALDMGRIYLLRTEMQNAVDTAARAGALELDAQSGALNRAQAAVADLLGHEAHFSKDRELLGQKLIDNYGPANPEQSTIVFYSWIGSSDHPDVGNPEQYCTDELAGTWLADEYKCQSTDDATAHYVEVRLDPELLDADPDSYTVDLFFLPVQEIVAADVQRFASLKAQAVAGRHFLVCNYPPVMFCNPFESDPGETFAQAVDPARPGGPLLEPGDSLVLKYQSGSWAPGNFAFLLPKDDDGNYQTGARKLGEYIANPDLQGCNPPEVRTRTGSVQSWPIWGWNTRFDYYQGFNANNYPPAPNVMEYPQDEAFVTIGGLSDRFGNGVWSAADYWTEFHDYHSDQEPKPSGWDDWTRWQVYNWELSGGFTACDPDGPDNVAGTGDDITCLDPLNVLPVVVEDGQNLTYADPWTTPEPDRETIYDDPVDPAQRNTARPVVEGLPDRTHVAFGGSPESVADRRVLFTAVLDCESQGIGGSKDAVAGAFAKFFIIQTATQGASGTDYVVEYMGLADEQDEEYHVDVQLYE